MRIFAHEVCREANLKWKHALQLFNLLGRELHLQRLNVVVQMLDFATTDDGKDVGCLGHHIGECDGGDRFDAVFLCYFLESLTNFDFFFILIGGAGQSA